MTTPTHSRLPHLITAVFWILSALALPVRADEFVIRNAQVFDAIHAQPVQTDVLVRAGRIAALAPELPVADGTAVVDARGLALIPGLFDVHTHWTPGLPPSSSALVSNAYLAAGVTTLSDFHQAPEAWQPRREWLSTLASPRVRFAARMSTPLGHGADWADQATTKWVNSPDAARAAVRELLPYQPDLIKVFADGWRYGYMPDNTSMDEWTLAALAAEAHLHGLKVATHTVTVERGKVAARAGVDLIAHSLLDRPVDDELVALMRENGTAYAPTLAVYEPVKPGQLAPENRDDPAFVVRQRNFSQALHNLLALHRGGVMIALGTDAGMPDTPHGRAAQHELELLVLAGLTPAEALQAATLNSARALGLDAGSGSIEIGKRADLVLVEGTPWHDVTDMQRVRQVFVEGHPVHPGGLLPASLAKADGPNLEPWPAPLPVAGALIDDMEREDGRTTLDTLRTGEADGGNDRSWQVIQRVPRAGGGHALLVTASLSHKPAPYANIVFPLSRGSVLAADVSAWGGVEFEIRGNLSGLGVQLRTQERQHWQVSLPEPPGGEWQRVRVAFADAHTMDARNEAMAKDGWNGQALLQLVLIAHGTPGSSLWYEVDNVRLLPASPVLR